MPAKVGEHTNLFGISSFWSQLQQNLGDIHYTSAQLQKIGVPHFRYDYSVQCTTRTSQYTDSYSDPRSCYMRNMFGKSLDKFEWWPNGQIIGQITSPLKEISIPSNCLCNHAECSTRCPLCGTSSACTSRGIDWRGISCTLSRTASMFSADLAILWRTCVGWLIKESVIANLATTRLQRYLWRAAVSATGCNVRNVCTDEHSF